MESLKTIAIQTATKGLLLLTLCLMTLLVKAETPQPVQDSIVQMGPSLNRFQFETRMAWTGEHLDGHMVDENTGFKGQYFNLCIEGQIIKGLDFSYRQRMNRRTDQTFWDATDWVHLTWHINPRWQLSTGKQVVAIGGFEYDRAPIDLYYNSEFWQHIPCYQMGLSTTWQIASQHSLLLQLCNSPLRPWVGNNQYGMNLMWKGCLKGWKTLWSYNAMQAGRGRWMYFLALGNSFSLTPWIKLEADYTHRGSEISKWFTGDYTIATELSASPLRSGKYKDALHVFAKYTCDQNKACDEDLMVHKHTALQSVGIGAEFHPIPVPRYRDDVRLFVAATYVWGENADTGGTNSTLRSPDENILQTGKYYVQAGLKFRLDLTNIYQYLRKRIRENNQT